MCHPLLKNVKIIVCYCLCFPPVFSMFKLDASLRFDLNNAGSTPLCRFYSLLRMGFLFYRPHDDISRGAKEDSGGKGRREVLKKSGKRFKVTLKPKVGLCFGYHTGLLKPSHSSSLVRI